MMDITMGRWEKEHGDRGTPLLTDCKTFTYKGKLFLPQSFSIIL